VLTWLSQLDADHSTPAEPLTGRMAAPSVAPVGGVGSALASLAKVREPMRRCSDAVLLSSPDSRCLRCCAD